MNQCSENPRFTEPRAAYVHVPFCRHRCGYCNFTLVAGRDDLIPRFLQALARELSGLEAPRLVRTLFLGGGTPTHLAPDQLGTLFSTISTWLPLETDGEYSVEANPLDLTPERIAVLQEAGVNRLSLGVQSFADDTLRFLERDHRGTEAQRAVEEAQAAFPAVSLDLIFGVPGQSLAAWQQDLARAVLLKPQHISVYGLTFDRGSAFWGRVQRGTLRPCEEELERAMYEAAIDHLTSNGYVHYEVSNFSRPGFACRHNEVYWTGGTYWAFGPGAARHVAGVREVNHGSTTTYLQRVLSGQSPVAERESLAPEAAARERLVFGLRRLQGVHAPSFHRQTGWSVSDLGGTALERQLQAGLLEWSGENLRLTRSGLLLSDSLWPDLL